MQDLMSQKLRAHQNNLDRYARLLATKLTDVERQYIHRRIAEEHSAIARIEAEQLARAVASSADPKTLIAARAAAHDAAGRRAS
jgi:hypothetical protein